jgi:D-arabinose 1-dehydrogenase-like Zn-dependent alcohol dehydrogenase
MSMHATGNVAEAQRGQVAYMPSPGEVELREYAVPRPGPGAILLKTIVAGVCGSEIHMFEGRHPVLRSIVLGHEIVGAIAELGEGVQTDRAGRELRVGDQVSVTYFRSCMKCPACARQELGWCETALDGWLQPPDVPPHFCGTMASHYYVDPRQWVFKLPVNVTPAMAAAANCALAQVVNAVERAEVKPGDSVVVQGAGGLGLYAIGLLKERGARVVSIDSIPLRLDRARAFGADHVIDMREHDDPELRRGRLVEHLETDGADIAIDVSGNVAAFVEGIGLLRPGGRLVEVGMVLPGQEVSFDLGSMTRRGVSVIPVLRYEPRHLQEALAFLSRNVGRLPLAEMIDASYGLEEVEQAIADSAARKVTRAAVWPNGVEADG